MPSIVTFEDLQRLISKKFTKEALLAFLKKKNGQSDDQIGDLWLEDETSKKGDSYLSTICRFSVSIRNGSRIPMIAKSLPLNPCRRKTMRSVDFFKNEIMFYQKTWAAIEEFQYRKKPKEKFDSIPVLVAAVTDGSDDFVTLEKFDESFKSPQRDVSLDYEHTVLALKVLAGFNGMSLCFKDQNPAGFETGASYLQETYFGENFREWHKNFHVKVLAMVRDAIEKELPQSYLDKYTDFIACDLFAKMCKLCQLRSPLSVITHGDTWAPNFLFQYDESSAKPKRAVIIDFQLSRYTSLCTDLTFFLLLCVDTKLLEAKWDELISVYHQALIETLEQYGSNPNIATLEMLNDEIKECMPYGVYFAMENLGVVLLNDSDVCEMDSFVGDEPVGFEDVLAVHPWKEKEKRMRLATVFKFVVDKNFI